MTEPIARRESDGEDSEDWRRRRWRGLDPREFPDEPELMAGFGRWQVKATGLGVLLLLAVTGVIGSNLWAGFRIEQTIIRENQAIAKALTEANQKAVLEHAALRLESQRNSCISTMAQDERTWFRRNYQPGSFPRACPWIGE